jgi:hypothetical protein
MKTYEITFQNAEVRTMIVTDDSTSPAAEVAKWGDSELSIANIVTVVEI